MNVLNLIMINCNLFNFNKMPVIYRSSNDQQVVVPIDIAISSKFVENMIGELRYNNNNTIVIDIPKEYTSVFHLYIDYLFGRLNVDSANELFLCFKLEIFIDDAVFFLSLMQQAYNIWVDFSNLLPVLDDREVYLRSPYMFVPTWLMDNKSFFDEWIILNVNKSIILNYHSEVYHTEVKYYDNSNQMEDLYVHHMIKGEKHGRLYNKAWYPNGSLEYQDNSIIEYNADPIDQQGWYSIENSNFDFSYDEYIIIPDGLKESWFVNGQNSYKYNYDNGKLHGLYETWYEPTSSNINQLETQGYLEHGQKQGLWQKWYKSGQLKTKEVYENGRTQGLEEEWYDIPSAGTGETSLTAGAKLYSRNYANGGRTQGVKEYWYPSGQLKIRSDFKDGNRHGVSESWYDITNGQQPPGDKGLLKYRRIYNMGNLVSDNNF